MISRDSESWSVHEGHGARQSHRNRRVRETELNARNGPLKANSCLQQYAALAEVWPNTREQCYVERRPLFALLQHVRRHNLDEWSHAQSSAAYIMRECDPSASLGADLNAVGDSENNGQSRIRGQRDRNSNE